MKGATPSGPITLVTIKTDPEHGRLRDDGQSRESLHQRARPAGGRYCDAMPATIARTTPDVTSGDG